MALTPHDVFVFGRAGLHTVIARGDLENSIVFWHGADSDTRHMALMTTPATRWAAWVIVMPRQAGDASDARVATDGTAAKAGSAAPLCPL